MTQIHTYLIFNIGFEPHFTENISDFQIYFLPLSLFTKLIKMATKIFKTDLNPKNR